MLIKQIISMIKICKHKKKEEKKKSIYLDLINNPDDFKLELYTENEEIVVKIKRNIKNDEKES